MINATEAQRLYEQPSYTEQEIEYKIREVATTRGWKCFDKTRLSDESRKQLEANGFKVQLSGDDYIVSWEQESADKAA